MTGEEAKKAAEVMMAYAEGKKIEYKVRGGDEWRPINELDTPLFDWNSTEYRIKKEPTYRPFKNKEECWEEMQKHQPFGWVINREFYESITGMDDTYCCTDTSGYDYNKALKELTFADGTPFGVKE